MKRIVQPVRIQWVRFRCVCIADTSQTVKGARIINKFIGENRNAHFDCNASVRKVLEYRIVRSEIYKQLTCTKVAGRSCYAKAIHQSLAKHSVMMEIANMKAFNCSEHTVENFPKKISRCRFFSRPCDETLSSTASRSGLRQKLSTTYHRCALIEAFADWSTLTMRKTILQSVLRCESTSNMLPSRRRPHLHSMLRTVHPVA